MIELHIEPRVSKTWDAFCEENPPFSIALDGYVDGPPSFSRAGPHANFDHHAKVDRLATRSTCMQVYMALTMGLFDTFTQDDKPFARLFVNDPDQDTCLAVWTLRNPELCRDLEVTDPIARLLLAEDILDCTAGAYPVQAGRPQMQRIAWIFDPYTDARLAGELARMGADRMREIIKEVGDRITAYVGGRGGSVELDTRYERIGGGPGWQLIVEHGMHARTALFTEHVRAFISVRENRDGTWTYVLGKMSPFVRFPVDELYALLNEAEGRSEGAPGWGGSNIVGGSPREGGSRLSPQEVERIVNDRLAADPAHP